MRSCIRNTFVLAKELTFTHLMWRLTLVGGKVPRIWKNTFNVERHPNKANPTESLPSLNLGKIRW